MVICRRSELESSMRLEVENKAELRKVQDELARLKSESGKQRIALEEELSKALQDADNHQLRIQQMGESNKALLEQTEGLKRFYGMNL